MQEIKQRTPWYVDNAWSSRTKNLIRLISLGSQLVIPIITTVNELILTSQNVESQRREPQTLKDANHNKTNETLKEWISKSQFEKDVTLPFDKVMRAKIEKTRVQDMRARKQMKLNNAIDGRCDRDLQDRIDETRNADVAAADEKKAAFQREFAKNVQMRYHRVKNSIPRPMVSCAEFTVFSVVQGDGSMVTAANGVPVASGFSTDGRCQHAAPPDIDRSKGFVDTYLNYYAYGDWFTDTVSHMFHLTDETHQYGYDYFFKNYIQEQSEAKAAGLTQKKWNEMSVIEKAPHMKEFHRNHPSVSGLSLSANQSGGGFQVINASNGDVIGEYKGDYDPYSSNKLPPNWTKDIKYADNVTPLHRQHPISGGGLTRDGPR